MKRFAIFILMLLGLAGVAFAQQEAVPSQADLRFQDANQWLNQSNLSITTSPEQAFMSDYVLVKAEGLPKQGVAHPGQKRLTAIAAAKALAYRELAAFLDGVAVASDKLVKDSALEYDVVRTAVAGFIKGAQVVYEEYNPQEETAIVFIKVGMTGPKSFAKVMYEKMLGDPSVRQAIVEPNPAYRTKPVTLEERYDGLIIDATEQSFRPALINRIFTPKGEVLYDPSKISQKVLVEQGCGEYTNSVDKAKAALETRGVRNPLIVKASGTVSPSDLQVADDDAVKIFSANQKANFLAGAKVAFVLK